MKKIRFFFYFLILVGIFFLLFYFYNLKNIDKDLSKAEYLRISKSKNFKAGNYYFVPDNQVFLKTNSVIDLADLVGVKKNGYKTELPYEIFTYEDKVKEEKKNIEIPFEKINSKTYILKIKDTSLNGYYIDNVLFRTNEKDFDAKYSIYFSNDGKKYFKANILDDGRIYWAPEGQKLKFNFEYSNPNYLKVVLTNKVNIEKFYFLKKENKTELAPRDIQELKVEKKDFFEFVLFQKNKIYFDDLKIKFKIPDKDFNLEGRLKIFAWNGEEFKDLIYDKEVEIDSLNSELKIPYQNDYQKVKLIFEPREKTDKVLVILKAYLERKKKIVYFRTNEDFKEFRIYYPTYSLRCKVKDLDFNFQNSKEIKFGKEEVNNKTLILKLWELFKNKVWVLYVFGSIVFILIFFEYKLYKENKNRTHKPEIKI